jgi:N utilization substance protein A
MQNAELKAIFEYLSRDRKLPDSTIFSVIADSLAAVGRKAFGGREVRVLIDPRTYSIDAFLSRDIVETVRDRATQISLAEARRRDPAAQVGGTVETPVTLASFGRIAIQNFRQVITQRLRAVEREKVYDEYRTRIGHLVTGTIRGFERSDVIVDFGDCEGVLPSRERVQSETYNTGDTINFLLVALNDERSNGSLLLSRASTDFIRELFRKEVAEIADGSVVIKSVSREPGFRTKIAVWSADEKIDPVGACVGLRGARVKNIVRELGGEKVDIVRYSDDIRSYVAAALAPAKLMRVTPEEDERKVTVIVPADQLSVAIGKRGQNARLTARLTGWKIDIHRDENDLSPEEMMANARAALVKALGVDEALSAALVSCGFTSVEGIAAAEPADLVDVEGLDGAAAAKLHAKAVAAAEAAAEAEAASANA